MGLASENDTQFFGDAISLPKIYRIRKLYDKKCNPEQSPKKERYN